MIEIIKGNEPFFIYRELERIKKESADADFFNFDGSSKQLDINELIEACTSQSLFSLKKCIFVEEPYFLIKKADSEIDSLIDYCRNPFYEVDLVFYTINNSFNERLKAYKDISSNAKIIQCDSLKKNDFSSHCMSVINQEGLNIKKDAARKLIDICCYNISLFYENLELLKIYPGAIDVKVIDGLCTGSHDDDIFDLINSMIYGKLSDSIRIFRQLKTEYDSVLGIISMLSNQLRFLYYVSYLKRNGYRLNDIADKTRSKTYRIEMAFKSLYSINEKKILDMLGELSRINYEIMTNNGFDEFERFEMFIVKTTSRAKSL